MRPLLVTLFVVIFLHAANAQVVINEFSAANYNLNDFSASANDAYEDWIELYNTSSSTLDLSGYHLSDKLNNLDKWSFPNGTTITPNGKLLVLATGGEDVNPSFIYTNFKLTQTKGSEYIVLSTPLQVIVDSIRLNRPNQMNHSTGRATDGAPNWMIFTSPTIGNPNSGGYNGYAPAPTFDIASGFHPTSINLAMSSSLLGADIRFTLDGSEPNIASPLYQGPIAIPFTMVVKAKTFSNDPTLANSHTSFGTYFINENHGVKVISVAGEQVDNLLNGNDNIEPVGSFEIYAENHSLIAKATGDYNEHGNDSWAYPQRGIDWITRDQLGYDYIVRGKLFPTKSRTKFQRLILKAGASDNYPFEPGGAHIRDPYVQMLSQLGDLRLDERTYEPAILYVNGNYWGVYEIREKTDDHDFTEYYYDQGATELEYLKTWGGTWEEYGDNSQANWNSLLSYILTTDMTIPANYQHVKSQYNTASLIDYFILNSYVVNADWLNWNTAWWRGLNPDGTKKKWRYALWDMDATFDHYINFTGIPTQSATADPCDPEQLGDPGGQGHVPIWNKLLTNDDFFADYVNRYAELSSTVFTCDSMHAVLDKMINEIQPEMQRHMNLWGGNMTDWQNNVQNIRDFVDTRCANIASDVVDCYSPAISGPYQVIVDVNPPNTGDVQLHTVTPSTYPFSATYFGGVSINLEAEPDSGYVFDYWEIVNGNINPSTSVDTVSMQLNADDTIIAHFKPAPLNLTDSLVIILSSDTGGIAKIGIAILTTASNILVLNLDDPYSLDAYPSPGFSFDHWLFKPSNQTETNPNSSFLFTDQDSIIVFFKKDSIVNGISPYNQVFNSLEIYPSITQDQFNLNISPKEATAIEIAIYGLNGHLAKNLGEYQLDANQTAEKRFDVSDLASGTYLVAIKSDGQNWVSRLTVVD